jgi:hypothetical protein
MQWAQTSDTGANTGDLPRHPDNNRLDLNDPM